MKPLNTAAGAVLALLAAVMVQNYAAGTLGDWFRSKFLNISPTDNARPVTTGGAWPADAAAQATGTGPMSLTGIIAGMGDSTPTGTGLGASVGAELANTPKAVVNKVMPWR